MRRFVAATLMVTSIGVGVAAAQAPAATAGCSARATDRTVRAWRGSLSAKGSTPIGGGTNDALTPRRETAGSNTPKSSTPIGAATTPADRPRTGGVVTPKGSTPVPSGRALLAGCAP